MAGAAEIDMRKSSHPVSLDIAMAERAIEIGFFFVNRMVEKDGLLDRSIGEDWKEGKERLFRLDGKAMVSHDGKKQDEEKADGDSNLFSHGSVDSVNPGDPIQIQEVSLRFHFNRSRFREIGSDTADSDLKIPSPIPYID